MKLSSYLIVFILVLFGCNSDDDSQQNTDSALIGTWSLVNVQGGLAGVDDSFAIGTITWSFNENNSLLTVTNNNTTTVIYDGFSSGTYNYQLLTHNDGNPSVIINSFEYNITTLTASQLILDEGVTADGFLLTFSR